MPVDGSYHFERSISAVRRPRRYVWSAIFCAATEEKLNNCLQDWLSSKALAILEVYTPRAQNDIVLDDYFNYLKYGRS